MRKMSMQYPMLDFELILQRNSFAVSVPGLAFDIFM